MAEWERSTRFLYERQLWFASYIEEYCRSSFMVPVLPIYSKNRFQFVGYVKRRLYQFLRRELLVSVKLLQSHKELFVKDGTRTVFEKVPDAAGVHYSFFIENRFSVIFFFKNIVGKLSRSSILLGFESFSFLETTVNTLDLNMRAPMH